MASEIDKIEAQLMKAIKQKVHENISDKKRWKYLRV